MQWDDSANAGFTTGIPWLKAGKSYPEINVENEMQGPIFTFYQKLIALRKELPIIAEGSYRPVYEDSQQIYAFERQLGAEKLLVLNNFYPDPITIDILPEYQNGEVLLSNYEEAQTAEVVTLRPYESLAIIVNKH